MLNCHENILSYIKNIRMILRCTMIKKNRAARKCFQRSWGILIGGILILLIYIF